VSVARGRVRLNLSEHKGDARPNTLINLHVNEVDAVSEEFGIPVDEEGPRGGSAPWKTRMASAQRANRPGRPSRRGGGRAEG
jgi:hypothetical protein